MTEAAELSPVRIGGMLVGYHVICPRKAWLSMHGLWMEQGSEAVALGRLIGESSYRRRRKELDIAGLAPDGTTIVGRIDWADLRNGVLHETKKSRSVEHAHRLQLQFYLWLLKLAGATRHDGAAHTGMLNYPALKRKDPVTLTPEVEERLARIVAEIRQLATDPQPPPRTANRAFCRKCAFEELCHG